MVELWDDDERGPHKMPYSDDCGSVEEEYVPIWKILKEYYLEEQEKLYIYTKESPRKKIVSTMPIPMPLQEDDYSDEYYSEDEEEEVVSDNDEPSEEPQSNNTDIGDIIDKEIYKKFSYI